MTDKSKQGKKNRQAGARFELKVRKDLENLQNWNVSKFMNNVDIANNTLIPAKHKFRGKGIPMAIGTGFPDFICWKKTDSPNDKFYWCIGVEVKSNGYLTKEEKEKCKWLLDNDVFSVILIASKGEKRGKIVYKEFER